MQKRHKYNAAALLLAGLFLSTTLSACGSSQRNGTASSSSAAMTSEQPDRMGTSAVPMFGNATDFTFAIQADSHLDENTVPALYEKTLAQIKADAPSFLMDLGDTFTVEKLTKTYAEAEARFELQKSICMF